MAAASVDAVDSQWSPLVAVVPAGGAGRRMGGAGKPTLPVGGTAMLARVLGAVEGAAARVVVGPPDLARALPPGVILTQEQPPGGGPVAALAAGLAAIPAPGHDITGHDGTGHDVTDAGHTVVAFIAGDLPFLTAGTIRALRERLHHDGLDGAVLRDDTGREQWLCGVWRLAALGTRVAELGGGHGRGMRDLAATLRVAAVTLSAPGPPPWFDCDTPDDLRQAEEWVHGDAGRMDR